MNVWLLLWSSISVGSSIKISLADQVIGTSKVSLLLTLESCCNKWLIGYRTQNILVRSWPHIDFWTGSKFLPNRILSKIAEACGVVVPIHTCENPDVNNNAANKLYNLIMSEINFK